MVCGTLARIGGEVYELQRPEIGELAEPTTATAVGSITMPHKRNPESSEHLDTLARLARSSAAVLTEGMTQLHERDGRGWKAEWVALPEVCLLTGAALRTARTVVSGLEVHAGVMAANLVRHGDTLASERVLAGLSTRLGKHEAQEAMQEVLAGRPADLADSAGAAPAGLGRGRPRLDWPAAGGHGGRDGRRGTGSRRRGPGRRAGDLAMIPPRFPLAVLPTPLVRAHRLEAVLGRGRVLLKRDDLAGFAVGGNKTRPLEYLLGRALADRCDVLVTGGGPGSNFCPAAAVAARAAGWTAS